ncbi:hypothetical protein LZ30DRAFT_701869 [Colletotrichum cereale]|nr:hypothetical protein LZ30DRAFT_701869 [Colletotrichum cereale]
MRGSCVRSTVLALAFFVYRFPICSNPFPQFHYYYGIRPKFYAPSQVLSIHPPYYFRFSPYPRYLWQPAGLLVDFPS